MCVSLCIIDRTVTCTRRYESRDNARKSPRLSKRRRAPLNRRFPRCRAKKERERERKRERESSDKQQHCSQKPLLPDSALYCGLGEEEAARTFCRSWQAFFVAWCSYISLLNAIAEVRSFPTRHNYSACDDI